MAIERCVGCGAAVPAMNGPIHRYMTSAPACWQRYGDVLSVLYQHPPLQESLILCTDTYAVQHPGTPNPQAIQSVTIHLLNLYGYLVRGRPIRIPQATFSNNAFHAIAPPASRTAYWLEPPSFVGVRTVFDMQIPGTYATIIHDARAWAESVWAAWSLHHTRIAAWYAHYARS